MNALNLIFLQSKIEIAYVATWAKSEPLLSAHLAMPGNQQRTMSISPEHQKYQQESSSPTLQSLESPEQASPFKAYEDFGEYNGPVKKRFGYYLIYSGILLLALLFIAMFVMSFAMKFVVGALEKFGSDLIESMQSADAKEMTSITGTTPAEREAWNISQLKRLFQLINFMPAYYILMAAFVVMMITNIVILAVPKLTTSKRYFWRVFGMYYASWVVLMIPVGKAMQVFSVLIRLRGDVKRNLYFIYGSEFNGDYFIAVGVSLAVALIPALITAAIYTMSDYSQVFFSGLKCLKPFKRVEY